LRVGYYSPLPPERSGVADYSALLLPALETRLEVVVASRRLRESSNDVDVRLYHMGNNPQAHAWILDALRRRPGVVVLHEVGLHELIANLTLGSGDSRAYLDAVEREDGAEARLLAQGTLEGLLPPLWEIRPLDFPLVDDLLTNALGVIVHSRFAELRLRDRGHEGKIWRIPFPAAPRPEVGEAGLPVDRFPIVSSLGGLTYAKRIPQLLDAFASLRRRFPRALLVLAGSGAGALHLDARLERLGLVRDRDVLCLGHVTEGRFLSLMAHSDVCVSLRWPTLGETSASVISALGLGKAVVVTDVGWYSELPDGVAAKVPLGEREGDLLSATLELLAEDERLRNDLGAAAAAYARREHDLEGAADAYVEALEASVGDNGARATRNGT
jgi:glycosyltransferase involved in cell wall biosynthesis